MRPEAAGESRPVPAILAALEAALRGLIEAHDRLLALLERKREAIRSADLAALSAMAGDEQREIERIITLDAQRVEAIRALAAWLKRPAAPAPTVSEIAAAAGEPAGPRLAALGAQLRDRLIEAHRASSVLRAAAEALSRHMTGLIQTVQSALSRARVYGQRGRIDPGAQVQFALDIRS
jgi:predicted signal transduction protein with EAL and GGDEF domain